MGKETTKTSLLAVTKRFLALWLPAVFIVFAVTVLRNYELGNDKLEIIKNNDLHHLEIHRKGILKDFQMIISDLIFLSHMAEFQNLFQGNSYAVNELLEEWIVLCKERKIYNEIGFLDETGKESISVYFDDGEIATITEGHDLPTEEILLFQRTFLFRQGEVYVSPLSLIRKKEGEGLEKVIYLSTPIYDRKGQIKGVLFIKYFADNITHNFDSGSLESYNGQAMLLNSQGNLLFHKLPKMGWGGGDKGENNLSFAKTFPSPWQKMNEADSGQFIDSNGALFTFDTVFPLWRLCHN